MSFSSYSICEQADDDLFAYKDMTLKECAFNFELNEHARILHKLRLNSSGTRT